MAVDMGSRLVPAVNPDDCAGKDIYLNGVRISDFCLDADPATGIVWMFLHDENGNFQYAIQPRLVMVQGEVAVRPAVREGQLDRPAT